ncbi:MAG: hypothetical protein ACYCO3_03260 [Mycobacteriales bacterium]
MKRLSVGAALLGLSASSMIALVALAGPAAATSCTPVNTSEGNLTAAVYDTAPSDTTVNAKGCDIGVYYDAAAASSSYDLSNVTVENATQYGVLVDGIRGPVRVDVTDSTVTNIGDTPFDGNQYGVGVEYYGIGTTGTVTGTVNGNTINQYQKGGIVVNGTMATVTVSDNTVTGLGPFKFNAQNGIQFGFGANLAPSQLTGNTVTDNIYTAGAAVPSVATGILLYQPTLTGFGHAHATATIETSNSVSKNQANVAYAS